MLIISDFVESDDEKTFREILRIKLYRCILSMQKQIKFMQECGCIVHDKAYLYDCTSGVSNTFDINSLKIDYTSDFSYVPSSRLFFDVGLVDDGKDFQLESDRELFNREITKIPNWSGDKKIIKEVYNKRW